MKLNKTITISLIGVAVVFFVLGAVIFGGTGGNGGDRAVHDHSVASEQPQVWTCSMHPQIKLPSKGKCPICYMDLIPLDTGTDDELGPRQLKMSDTAKQLARIETTPAIRAFAEAQIRMVGRISHDETKLAYITAWVPGRIDRLYADFTGIAVSKGDHMVLLYSPELLATQEELVQANAAVEALSKTTSSILRSTAAATVEAAREKLRLYGLTNDQIQSIETSGETSDKLTVYAPIGGVVIHKDAKEGMYVSTGTRIYTIADLSKLWVMFEAYESDLPWLRFGQRVEFESPSFPGEKFEATISFIDPVVNPGTRTVRVRAIVENKNKTLKPDMFVRGVVRSRLDSKGNVIDEYPTEEDAPILIPVTAPLITGTRAVVYVELTGTDTPVFEGREIELGPRAGDFFVVKSGIDEGERVVTNGAFKIDSELQIRAKPSMMSPAGGAAPSGHGAMQHGAKGSSTMEHDTDAQTADDAGTSTKRFDESSHAVRALTPVYDAYFDVQMALAQDDLATTRKAATALTGAVEKQDGTGFTQAGRDKWRSLRKPLLENAKRIAKAKDIATARDGFFHLSESAVDLHKNFGHSGDESFYLTFCPMAREGGGAFWLQTLDVVWNSFYGEQMLRCGTIKEELPPRSRNMQ